MGLERTCSCSQMAACLQGPSQGGEKERYWKGTNPIPGPALMTLLIACYLAQTPPANTIPLGPVASARESGWKRHKPSVPNTETTEMCPL